jgi:DNA-binding GntR family transcriptional regulator
MGLSGTIALKNAKSSYARPAATATPFGGAQPRYLALAESLSEAIRSGEYPVGGLLPAEADLCETFKVSRHTVREAIRKLRDLGLVSRHQGVGTRVENSDISGRFVLSLGSIPDIWQYVQATRFEPHSKKVIAAADAEIPLPPIGNEERWLLAEGLRYVAGQALPISHSAVHINGAFRGVTEQIGHKQVPIFSLVERRYGLKVVEIKQEISAILVPARLAKPLKVKPNSPALCIIRRYLTADGLTVEVGRSITPGDRFKYSVDLHFEYPLGQR